MANIINMGGAGANIAPLTVQPATSQLVYTPRAGIDGYNPITVRSVRDVIITANKIFSSASDQSISLNTNVPITEIVSVSLIYAGTTSMNYGIDMLCYTGSNNRIKVVQKMEDGYVVSDVANGTIANISINSDGAIVIQNVGSNIFESSEVYACFAAVHIR